MNIFRTISKRSVVTVLDEAAGCLNGDAPPKAVRTFELDARLLHLSSAHLRASDLITTSDLFP